jgi:hypothetical protein
MKILAEDDPYCSALFNGFRDVIVDGALGELRDKPYGENVVRANKKDGVVYKEYINYYFIPKEMGKHKAIIEKFRNTMVKLLNSDEFFTMMTVYQDGRPQKGKQHGNVLREPSSEVWKQLKAVNNSRVNYMDALNGRFTDDDINIILSKLFNDHSIEARYQKFGWHNIESNPWKKSKKM